MEGFKANPKMKSDIACYKEGGSVYKSRTHKEDPAEAAEDKALVKKGIRQHEAAKHKGEEKTEIKLKQGGRAKKEKGTVKKYKAGGKTEPKKMAKGGFFNEEPDDFTAVPTKPAAKKAKPKKKPMPKAGAVSDYERQQVMDMFQGGPGEGAVSDYESQQLPGYEEGGFIDEPMPISNEMYSPELSASPKPSVGGDYLPESSDVFAMTTAMPTGGKMPRDARKAERMAMRQQKMADRMAKRQAKMGGNKPRFGGFGSAMNTGGLGGANPVGAAKSPAMTPEQADLMRGVQEIGKFCRGGQA